jgi:hypothetical protein
VKNTLTLDYVSQCYHLSIRTLTKKFSGFLANPPLPQEYFLKLKDKLKEQDISLGGYLLLDADWFGRERCLLLYKDHPSGKLLLWRFADGEDYLEILQDLIFLASHGYSFHGAVSDGRRSIAAALKTLSLYRKREILHQRCLVHTQLLVQSLLTQRPRMEAGWRLREIVSYLNQIRNHYEKNIWLRWLGRWEARYGGMLKERTYDEEGHWWYTHKNLRRAYRTLALNPGVLFRYLEDPHLPKDTNAIEGIFSQLDTKISRHRGLKQERKEALISYSFYLKEFPNFRSKTNT